MSTPETNRYQELIAKSFDRGTIEADDIRWILTSDEVELLPLLHAAYQIRYRYFGNRVKIHILHNVQSGGCTEDCKYCAQSGEAKGAAESYPMKSDEEIIEGARQAFNAGAFRHCMVFSGRDLSEKRIDRICAVVEKIKSLFPMEICISAGFLSEKDGKRLVNAGVNRYNHNLNTSSAFYGQICTTHEYRQRVETIATAKDCGLDICSGVIIGMGETTADIIQMTRQLHDVEANSIPVNFFIPVDGHRIIQPQILTPPYCLKVLCLFRFAVPQAEIRASAGREYHMRSLQSLCLYAANSLFAEGYLTASGDTLDTTRQLIEDSGFVVEGLE